MRRRAPSFLSGVLAPGPRAGGRRAKERARERARKRGFLSQALLRGAAESWPALQAAEHPSSQTLGALESRFRPRVPAPPSRLPPLAVGSGGNFGGASHLAAGQGFWDSGLSGFPEVVPGSLWGQGVQMTSLSLCGCYPVRDTTSGKVSGGLQWDFRESWKPRDVSICLGCGEESHQLPDC